MAAGGFSQLGDGSETQGCPAAVLLPDPSPGPPKSIGNLSLASVGTGSGSAHTRKPFERES